MSFAKRGGRRNEIRSPLPWLCFPGASALVLVTMATTVSLAEEPPTHRWEFAASRVEGKVVRAVQGDRGAVMEHVPEIAGDPAGLQALVLDGRAPGLTVSGDLRSVGLPSGRIALEAWVWPHASPAYSGFISAIEDNGEFERGVFLGTRDGKFCFALASESRQRLTYLSAPEPFRLDRWYHVAGTYDGDEQRLYVDGELVASSSEPSGRILYPRRGVFQIGAYRDRDELYPLEGLLHEVSVHARALEPDAVAARHRAKARRLPDPPREIFGPFDTVLGPFLEFTDPRTIRLSYETDRPVSTIVEFGIERADRRLLADPEPGRHHAVTIDGISPDTVYRYRLRGRSSEGVEILTEVYEFDSSFNYEPPPDLELPSPFPADAADARIRRRALHALQAVTGRDPADFLEPEASARIERVKGYALVLGAEDGRLVHHLARSSDLKIVVVERDPARVRRLREQLDRSGDHGTRVSVHQGSLSELPYGPYFANLIVTERDLGGGESPPTPAAELHRVLRPYGGVLLLSAERGGGKVEFQRSVESWAAPLLALEEGETRTFEADGTPSWFYRRGALPGAGDWSHQYGPADNSACSGDSRVKGDLGVLWWGRPGPRPMPDRGPRNPAPVASGGRLYVQGNRILFGLDAYNGTILWCKQIPTMRRANMPRDSSNMMATEDWLYVILSGRCVAFDGRTGERMLSFTVPPGLDGSEHAWGYLARVGRDLVGSGTRPGSHYLGDEGEWYEDYEPGAVAKVTSDYLFSRDRHTGSLNWSYRDGVVLNSAIAIGDGKLFFIESRSPAARQARTGRLQDEILRDQYLVALDLKTGEKLWEKSFDFSGCRFTTYLSYGGGTVLVAGSDEKKVLHTYAFAGAGGKAIWDHHVESKKTHHSGHLTHPVIIGDRVYLNKHVYRRETGEVLKVDDFDFHGCGVASASTSAIFHRFEYHGMWDLESDTRREFVGVRGGCWIGIIPAGGILLAPESGSGCSCTHAIQTSLGFYPLADFPGK